MSTPRPPPPPAAGRSVLRTILLLLVPFLGLQHYYISKIVSSCHCPSSDHASLSPPPQEPEPKAMSASGGPREEPPSVGGGPPEALETVSFCAEKCRYVPAMCDGLHRDKLSLPAPTCLNYSTTIEGDIYWHSLLKKDARQPGGEIYDNRNKKTKELVRWAAAQARERRAPGSFVSKDRCEDIPSSYETPMMFPEEFEFITKTMALARPKTYLEWGSGMSTSFYPLLASGHVSVIDGYQEWCDKVQQDAIVKCMASESRLQYFCVDMVGVNGTEPIVIDMGRMPRGTSDADVQAVANAYINAVERTNMTSFDFALVDGRFRPQCALKLLPYLHHDSVLVMHDFWLREEYYIVLDYFDVIGYARSAVAMKKKTSLNLSPEEERNTYKKFLAREYLKDDIQQ